MLWKTHTGNTWPSCMCANKKNQYYTMSLSQYHWCCQYYQFMSLPWPMSIPWVPIYAIGPCQYHEGISSPIYTEPLIRSFFENGPWDYNVTLFILVSHSISGRIIPQAQFYILGDFLDIQFPYMTKASFLFLKEMVLKLHLLPFICSISLPHSKMPT